MMHTLEPQMRNETTVTENTKYRGDAIYVMYAMFILMACVFIVIALVLAYKQCKNICEEYNVCQQPCCCYPNINHTPHYIVTTEIIPNDVDFDVDDYIIENYTNDNSNQVSDI